MDGILCLNKPQGMTSFACCAMLRRLTGEKKIGHAGTLDPMATGVLPLMFGKATRAIPLLPSHDKQYRATLRFGFVSDTLDIWGKVEPTGAPLPKEAEAYAVLERFRGEILQVPPMMSALKRDGVRLYELARQGVEVPREARPITVYHLDMENFDSAAGEMTVLCTCSAGTYIRTLCDDIGHALGCGAVMTALCRTQAAGYTLENCLTEEECRQHAVAGTLSAAIAPTETAFRDYPAVTVTEPQAVRFGNGGALSRERLAPLSDESPMRVYSPSGIFLGLGQPTETELQVLRLF